MELVSLAIALICHSTKLNLALGVPTKLILSSKQKKLFNWDIPLLTQIPSQATRTITSPKTRTKSKQDRNVPSESHVAILMKRKQRNIYFMIGLRSLNPEPAWVHNRNQSGFCYGPMLTPAGTTVPGLWPGQLALTSCKAPNTSQGNN